MSNVVKLKTTAATPKRQSIARAATASDKPTKVYEVRSDKVRGLLLRVMPSGLRTYYVQIGRGKRIRIGEAGIHTLAQAEQRAREILVDPEAATKKKSDGATLAEFIKDHYEAHALARLKDGAGAVARLKAAWKPLLSKRVTDIDAAMVDRLRTKRLGADVAPATVARDTAGLMGCLTYWKKSTKAAKHPLEGLESVKVADDERVRYLTPDEAARLRQALADRDAKAAEERRSANQWRGDRGHELLPEITGYCDHITPLVLLAMNTGMRRGELFGLDWRQIDIEHKTLTILAGGAKTGRTRSVPLNTEALAVLTAIKPEPAAGLVFPSPVTDGKLVTIKTAWREVTTAAKLPDVRLHDMRHHFASSLVMRGVPLYHVQKLLGHGSGRMTEKYAKLAPGALADAVNLLDAQ